jgi:hypothetical protein
MLCRWREELRIHARQVQAAFVQVLGGLVNRLSENPLARAYLFLQALIPSRPDGTRRVHVTPQTRLEGVQL